MLRLTMILLTMLLGFALPVFSYEHTLSSSVQWILELDGIKVVQSESTLEFDAYRLEPTPGVGSPMATIGSGLRQRDWRVYAQQDELGERLVATKGALLLRVYFAEAGWESPLMLEITEYDTSPYKKS